MSDRDLKRGIRAIISGGASELDEEALNVLGASWEKEKKSRDPHFISSTDAEYLSKFLNLSEELFQGNLTTSEANDQLDALNQEYGSKIDIKTLKKYIPGCHLQEREEQGWYSSFC